MAAGTPRQHGTANGLPFPRRAVRRDSTRVGTFDSEMLERAAGRIRLRSGAGRDGALAEQAGNGSPGPSRQTLKRKAS